MNSDYIVIRKLTDSDFGLFAEPRDRGRVKSKQRAININADIISRLLPSNLIDKGEVYLAAKCLRSECQDEQTRILSKVGKNWRLGGKKIPGKVFLELKTGDLFLCRLSAAGEPPFPMVWTVLFQDGDAEDYKAACEAISDHLVNRMAVFPSVDSHVSLLKTLLPMDGAEEPVSTFGLEPEPKPKNSKRKLTVKERLQQPYIVGEMVKASLTLSSKSQSDFLQVLETVASALRDMLGEANLIHTIPIDHQGLWKTVAGRPIAFIDGGAANLAMIGTEPVAIRVGSYVVSPGVTGADRESFKIEKQLVDELFEANHGGGVFDDYFEDPSKLRDVARISLEVAGAVTAMGHDPKPHFIFLHGALVNPVSSYALEGFPNFTQRALKTLLPETDPVRSGRNTNFVSVYLRQLELLRESNSSVCGVVERASRSTIVTDQLLNFIKTLDVSPGSGPLEQMKTYIREYRITDAVLFHCILNEGEYLEPISVDRNDLRRAPNEWKDLISQYPKPMVSYVGVGEMSLPLRVEFFADPPEGFDLPLRLIIHSCRLMPNYAFPAGLDIVDKFAKVPNWMTRPINSTLAVQFLKKAMDSGNPKLIEEAKRMLCGTTRDWLFRPTFNR